MCTICTRATSQRTCSAEGLPVDGQAERCSAAAPPFPPHPARQAAMHSIRVRPGIHFTDGALLLYIAYQRGCPVASALLCSDTTPRLKHLPLQGAHTAVHIVEKFCLRALRLCRDITSRLQRVDDGCELLHDTFAIPCCTLERLIRHLHVHTMSALCIAACMCGGYANAAVATSQQQSSRPRFSPAATASLSSLHRPSRRSGSHITVAYWSPNVAAHS